MYLQVDPAVSQKLMTGRYHGDESRKDVHEKDIEYLARSRRAAEYCAVHLGWATVHCTENGAMRTIEEIQAEVRALAEKSSDNRENGRDTINVSFDAAVG